LPAPAESLFAALLDSAPDAMVIADSDGTIVLVNVRAEELFGYARDELVGSSVDVLVPESFRTRHREHREAYFEAPRVRPMGIDLELFGVRKDGSRFPVEISLSPLETPDGVLVSAAVRDVTDRRVIEAELRRKNEELEAAIDEARLSEEKASGLLEAAPDAMVIANAEGTIVLVNARAEEVFGYSRDELLGSSVDQLVPESFRARHREHRSAYFQSPRVRPMGIDLELFGVRKDGSRFPVEISLSPLETPDGLVVSAAIRDVTDRRQIEAELRRKNAELEAAGESKDRFLASMSHELRTPLNSIIGFTGTLLMGLSGDLNEAQREQLELVSGSGHHLLGVIDDILDVTKIASGTFEPEREPVDVAALAVEVVDSLRPLAAEKRLELGLAAPAGPVELHSDGRALRQILLNLVGNAIKFTERGSVDVRLEWVGDGEQRLRISVADTGAGIASEDLARLFRPFEQIGTSATRRHNGTGLGLYLSASLATVLGGRITCESEPGVGSTFRLELAA
jgi:protein-histidine pros-kinase